jgi:hypothetical protein
MTQETELHLDAVGARNTGVGDKYSYMVKAGKAWILQ